jgi:excisionase family DNA binding protein
VTDVTFDRLLTAAELAEKLGMSVRWVHAHTANEEIPHVRFGRIPRYRLDRVIAWLEKNERGGREMSRERAPAK